MENFAMLEKISDELDELIENVSPWVVRVGASRGPSSSGVLWSRTQVLTVEHALGDGQLVEVALPDDGVMSAGVSGRAPAWNLALLQLERSVEMDPPPWSEEFEPGLVVNLGRDSAGRPLAALGLLASAEDLNHRAPRAPELLGGPVVDCRGQFIGVNCGAFPPDAMAYGRLRAVVDDMRSGRSVDAGFLGVGLLPVARTGCLVIKVEQQSPAEQAGVLVGDVLLKLDGMQVEGPQEVMRELRLRPPGTTVPLKMLRGGQPLELSVELAGRSGRGPQARRRFPFRRFGQPQPGGRPNPADAPVC